jgi:succinate-semialdehyde dehydrogenase/glutarate-semialdehyde dehydrogenase
MSNLSEFGGDMSALLIGGAWVKGHTQETLRDRYRGEPFGEMGIASASQVDAAVEGALAAVAAHPLSPYERFKILSKAASIVASRQEELIRCMTSEAGFTKADGEGEVRRCVQTLELCAEEAKRITGNIVPMEATPNLKNRMGFTIRVPKGVVCAITPYNSPLNTVAHKIGPALAAGNAVVLKPSEYTPLTAAMLCRALLDGGLPPTLLSLVHGTGDTVGRQLLADPRIAFYTFTGSTRVGREIQQAAGLRGTQLELGSIASTIVCADADLATALPKIVGACFRKAGQVCTSIQRLFVDAAIIERFAEQFVAATRGLKVGDPSEPGTVVGPMISAAQAERAENWIREAVEQGAKVLTGGTRNGAVLQPTVLTNVNPAMRVVCEEIFAPAVSIIPFRGIDAAIEQANATPYGLAVGLFTANLTTAFDAARKLRFGGVHINETSSSRVDVMPFGGVKDSGFGREGPQHAIREMTEERLITIAY